MRKCQQRLQIFSRIFKSYLRYKTIICHKAAPDVQLMNFFI